MITLIILAVLKWLRGKPLSTQVLFEKGQMSVSKLGRVLTSNISGIIGVIWRYFSHRVNIKYIPRIRKIPNLKIISFNDTPLPHLSPFSLKCLDLFQTWRIVSIIVVWFLWFVMEFQLSFIWLFGFWFWFWFSNYCLG